MAFDYTDYRPALTRYFDNIIIGSFTPKAATFTSVTCSGQLTSSLANGTPPFVVTSSTNVVNLNASSLGGATFAAPGAIGSGTASTAAFTTLSASGVSALTGAVGVGGNAAADTKLHVRGTYPTSGAITYVVRSNGTIPSGTTTGSVIFQSAVTTQAAAFTVATLWHFQAVGATIGSASSVGVQYGYHVDSSFTTATSNFGFYGNIAAGSNRWNFYGNGTARSLLNGDLTVFGSTAIPAGGTAGTGVMVSSTANFGVFFGSGVPTLSAAQGSLYLRSDGSSSSTRMYVNSDGSTAWVAVTTAS